MVACAAYGGSGVQNFAHAEFFPELAQGAGGSQLYAKQAIKVNASAYMLKPVDDRELYDTLSQLTAKLDAERSMEESGTQLREALPYIEKELVLSWLEGSASPELAPYAAQPLQLLAGECGLTALLLEIDDLEWRLNHLSEEAKSEAFSEMFLTVQKWCDEKEALYCMHDNRRRIVVIASCEENRTAELAEEWLHRVREQFAPFTVTIAVGSTAQRADGLRESYKSAKSALKEKLYLGKNRLILHSAPKKPQNRQETDINAAAEAMFHDMLQYLLVAVDERLESLFRQLDWYEDKAAIVNLIVHFISRLHMHGEQWNENLYGLLDWEYGSLGELYRFETLHDMNAWLRKRFFELSELLYRKQQKQNRKIIDSILAFVDIRLESKITLKQVAERFGFSPNYLGQLFKEETGGHFSDYVIRARMRKACELLLEPGLKIYEIADRMGYKNILYFNRQFKQLVGQTPGDYRKAYKV
ncbi:helix-turn-helix domain-containing protein [Paenibacillus solisilvae]|uniref:Helix-turn-helix domain-containing protein n=1 Tax=Paenibacillus solisilvae TaxID=2486751 RepID=A0ABW0W9L5_9BACL